MEKIRRKMKVIKKENDLILGEVICFLEEEWEQNIWGKYITDTIWNRKERLFVLFDLYEDSIGFVQGNRAFGRLKWGKISHFNLY